MCFCHPRTNRRGLFERLEDINNRIMEKTLSQVEQEISQMAESLSPDEIKEMINSVL